MLVRSFVGKRLAEYYGQPSSKVIGSTRRDDALPLKWLCGEWHWKALYRQLYRQQVGQWLTPVELFQPYYSNVIVNFIQSCVGKYVTSKGRFTKQQSNDCNDLISSVDLPVEIVELGGGRGTNAICILNRLFQDDRALYDRLSSYRIIDASSTLQALQRDRLLSTMHGPKIEYQSIDLLDVAEGRQCLLLEGDPAAILKSSIDPKLTIVIALELLDNLPHDKIRVGAGRRIEQAMLNPIEFDRDDDVSETQYEEIFTPLSDPLIQDVLEKCPSYRQASISWIPTVACGLLRNILRECPNAHLLLADFDWLPPPDLSTTSYTSNDAGWQQRQRRRSTWAEGEPLITSMQDQDYACYLEAPRFCDILFPTQFGKLSLFLQNVLALRQEEQITHGLQPLNPRTVTVHKQADFLQQYGADEVYATKSWLTGYSPLVDDFSNYSVLTVRQSPSLDQ